MRWYFIICWLFCWFLGLYQIYVLPYYLYNGPNALHASLSAVSKSPVPKLAHTWGRKIFSNTTVRDLTDHFSGQLHPVKFLELVMDVPCVHAPCIKGDYFFLNAGYVPLVFGDELRLEFTVTIPWDINLEFTILALECFGECPLRLLDVGESPFRFFW